MKLLTIAALTCVLLVPCSAQAQDNSCEWFANVYKLVAEAKAEGTSKSAAYEALATNQKSRSVRDTFLSIVNQVYVPDEANVHLTPEQFHSMALAYCRATKKSMDSAKEAK